MDREKIQRRQSFKVICSEIIMVLAVVATVAVLVLIVSGYWLNSNLEVERQGMLQIFSTPTGANVTIDGESSWLQRTNTSKILSSGEHSITLTKDGYDSWTKTINISEGLLYRIHYPRLFLNNRTKENITKTDSVTHATVSPEKDTLLLINNTTTWQTIRLNSDTPSTKSISVADYFSDVSLAKDAKVGLLSNKIIKIDWSQNGNRVLLKTEAKSGIEWVLIDIDNVASSVNLTKEFGVTFSDVRIYDDSANNLLVTQNNNLHKIDLSAKAISAIIVKDIINYDFLGNELVFSARNESGSYYIGLLKISDPTSQIVQEGNTPSLVSISQFYDNKYISILDQNLFSIYEKNELTKILDSELTFAPNSIKVGYNGEFIIMSLDEKIATLDMEAMHIKEWLVDSTNVGWLDNSMIYSVKDGELIVYDFDGLNRRVIAKNVSARFPVFITDNKWLYYLCDEQLMREWLIEH